MSVTTSTDVLKPQRSPGQLFDERTLLREIVKYESLLQKENYKKTTLAIFLAKASFCRHQENQLSLIEKQRRGWEGAREKAEEMAQIFDSLIITSNLYNEYCII